MVTVNNSIVDWIDHFLACMGGCFGSCAKSTPIISVDEPSKGLKIQGRTVTKPGISDDFWSTSTCDLESSALQSQRSVSSISTANQTLGHYIGTCGTCGNSDFVNNGLLIWNQGRMQWVGSSRPENRTQQNWEPKSSWPTNYESLLGTRNPFPRPIPLSVQFQGISYKATEPKMVYRIIDRTWGEKDVSDCLLEMLRLDEELLSGECPDVE